MVGSVKYAEQNSTPAFVIPAARKLRAVCPRATSVHRRSSPTLFRTPSPRCCAPPRHDVEQFNELGRSQTEFPIIEPILSFTSVQFMADPSRITSSRTWRFLLLSDGHIEQNINILTHGASKSEVLAESSICARDFQMNRLCEQTRLVIDHIPHLQLARQTALTDGIGNSLVHATAWWDESLYDEIMRGEEHRPMWQVFAGRKLETARRVIAVHYGTCDKLCSDFQSEPGTPLWARDYVFRKNRIPFLVVHELFAPGLAKYLGGPCEPPPNLPSTHGTLDLGS